MEEADAAEMGEGWAGSTRRGCVAEGFELGGGGRGAGGAALDLGRRLVPWAELRAVVLPGNVASHALFRAAGYTPVGGIYVNAPAPHRAAAHGTSHNRSAVQ